MGIGRMFRHLCITGLHLRSRFPPSTLDAIEAEIAKSEELHTGELRFAIETALDLPPLLHGSQSRQRALDVFSLLRVWDTDTNSGVLIYLLLVDHKVEIVADRGIAAKVSQHEWDSICRRMEDAYRKRAFEEGTLKGMAEITALLALHFPPLNDNPNELADGPVVL